MATDKTQNKDTQADTNSGRHEIALSLFTTIPSPGLKQTWPEKADTRGARFFHNRNIRNLSRVSSEVEPVNQAHLVELIDEAHALVRQH